MLGVATDPSTHKAYVTSSGDTGSASSTPNRAPPQSRWVRRLLGAHFASGRECRLSMMLSHIFIRILASNSGEKLRLVPEARPGHRARVVGDGCDRASISSSSAEMFFEYSSLACSGTVARAPAPRHGSPSRSGSLAAGRRTSRGKRGAPSSRACPANGASSPSLLRNEGAENPCAEMQPASADW
jgi:hypothetical protein